MTYREIPGIGLPSSPRRTCMTVSWSWLETGPRDQRPAATHDNLVRYSHPLTTCGALGAGMLLPRLVPAAETARPASGVRKFDLSISPEALEADPELTRPGSSGRGGDDLADRLPLWALVLPAGKDARVAPPRGTEGAQRPDRQCSLGPSRRFLGLEVRHHAHGRRPATGSWPSPPGRHDLLRHVAAPAGDRGERGRLEADRSGRLPAGLCGRRFPTGPRTGGHRRLLLR